MNINCCFDYYAHGFALVEVPQGGAVCVEAIVVMSDESLTYLFVDSHRLQPTAVQMNQTTILRVKIVPWKKNVGARP